MSKKNNNQINFSESLKELENIVTKLENPDLDLEEAITLLEKGVRLHKLLQNKLTEANSKITTILKEDQI